MSRGIVLGSVLAGLLLSALIACSGRQPTPEPAAPSYMVPGRDQRVAEIQALWTQIRDWRQRAGMSVEPSVSTQHEMRYQPLSSALRICPDPEATTAICQDVCSLADAICENADSICRIADELPGDAWAKDKCSSAKASCKEAKERCCQCEARAASATDAELDEVDATDGDDADDQPERDLDLRRR